MKTYNIHYSYSWIDYRLHIGGGTLKVSLEACPTIQEAKKLVRESSIAFPFHATITIRSIT